MKSKIFEHRIILECSCGTPNHVLVFDYDEDFKYVGVSFEYRKELPFLHRFRCAMSYLFRRKELCYNEIIIYDNNIDQLEELIQEIKKVRGDEEVILRKKED